MREYLSDAAARLLHGAGKACLPLSHSSTGQQKHAGTREVSPVSKNPMPIQSRNGMFCSCSRVIYSAWRQSITVVGRPQAGMSCHSHAWQHVSCHTQHKHRPPVRPVCPKVISMHVLKMQKCVCLFCLACEKEKAGKKRREERKECLT